MTELKGMPAIAFIALALLPLHAGEAPTRRIEMGNGRVTFEVPVDWEIIEGSDSASTSLKLYVTNPWNDRIHGATFAVKVEITSPTGTVDETSRDAIATSQTVYHGISYQELQRSFRRTDLKLEVRGRFPIGPGGGPEFYKGFPGKWEAVLHTLRIDGVPASDDTVKKQR